MGSAANNELTSAVPGARWPAIPSPEGAALLALQYQFEHSQWWPRAQLEAAQFRQLREVLAHAAQTVPFQRERLRAAGIDPARDIDPAAFARLPLLTRRDIQAHGAALMSQAPPRDHGHLVEHISSGSTGEPVRVYGTQVDSLFWCAHTLRDHLWHRRDFAGKLCAIRSQVNDSVLPGWGPATDAVFVTGPGAILNIATDTARQLEWLRQHDPAYLLSHPTNLRELARLSLKLGVRLPRLREARTFGEVLPAELRELCREAWDAKVVDSYSSEEVGYIALQCPEHEHYHVQAENLLIEIVDAAGAPCAPGAIGRVVVTTLHNFAMPLIRYALGDHAEVGETCTCGRGLPVLRRIMGRERNMLRLPDGTQHWPSFPEDGWVNIAPIQQLQAVQKALDEVVLRIRAPRALSADEASRLIATFKDTLKFPYRITIEQVASIQKNRNAKFEDFVSEIA